METQKIILAVDDQPEVLEGLFAILNAKYDVRIAKTAPTAFSVLHAEHVSLILLDIAMPRMDGFEFLEYLQSKPEYENIPVLFVTSSSDSATVTRSLAMGAKGYIIKPFTADTVLTKVSETIGD